MLPQVSARGAGAGGGSPRRSRARPPAPTGDPGREEVRRLVYALRWFGPEAPVTLAKLRQVPGLEGVVTALHDVPAGVAWTREGVAERAALLAAHGLTWTAVESIPVSEEIKTAGPSRDEHVAAWADSLRAVAAAGVRTVCYNFMPVL